MPLVLSGTDGVSGVDGTASNPAIEGTDSNTGIFYPAADTVAIGTGGTERLRVDSAGNAGLGVTPSAWSSQFKAIDIGTPKYACFAQRLNSTGDLFLGWNAYNDSTGTSGANGFKYSNTGDTAALYAVTGLAGHRWFTAPSGTAGNPITFTQAMTLTASGQLELTAATPRLAIAPSTGTNNAFVHFINSSSANFSYVGIDSNGGGLGGQYTMNLWHGANYALVFATSNIERARITSGGDFCVGKTSDTTASVGASLGIDGLIRAVKSASTSAGSTMEVYSTGAGAYRFFVGMQGQVYATNTTISSLSDVRHKENVQDLDVGLDSIMALKPRKFDWKVGKGKDIKGDRGFIAQEFEQVFPDLIDEWKDPAPEGEEPYKSVRQDLIPVLVKAIQELNAKVEAQAAEIAALKGNA